MNEKRQSGWHLGSIAGLCGLLVMGIATPASSQDAAKMEWDKVVKAARAEGKIVISHFTDAGIEPILKRFEEQFGIKVEASAGRPSAVIPKILTEQKNGQFNWDVLIQPVNNVRLVLEPAGGLEPILPYLFLPEVKDGANWYGGLTAKVPMYPLYTFYDGIAIVGTGIQVNRAKVSRDQFNNWKDLLKPEWKGKFGIYYPRRLATLSIALTCLRPGFDSTKKWEDYVRAFFAQKPVAAPRVRTVADWLVKGRYDVVVAAGDSYLTNIIKKLKLNIEDPVGDEFCGTTPTGTGRSLSVVKKPPHPNAAKLFANWYLTRDVQAELVKAYWASGEQTASRRKDVGHPDPAFQKAAIKSFEETWMKGKGLMSTSDEGLKLQQRVVALAKEAGY